MIDLNADDWTLIINALRHYEANWESRAHPDERGVTPNLAAQLAHIADLRQTIEETLCAQ